MIFNRKVPFEEYVKMSHVTTGYATTAFGSNIQPELIDQLTWNRILLLEAAKRAHIVVKNDEVVQNIVSLPVFQRNGVFDKKLYKSTLGGTVKGFEERLRDDIRISKLREKITADVSVTGEEVKEAYKKKFEKIKASYISIPFADSDADSEKEAKKLYLRISNEIKGGGVFEDVAKKIGKEVTKTDFIARGGYIPTLGPAEEFVEACSSLKTGEIAGPLKTPGSWVILKLDEYQAIDEARFSEEMEGFKEGLLSGKKQDYFDKWFEELKKEARFVSYTSE